MTKTAAELNELLAAYRAFELSRPFQARFDGHDAITGVRIYTGEPLRMLRGQALLPRSGIEVLTLAQPLSRRFVDDIEGDGVYYVVNKLGAAVRFEVRGELAYVSSNYGEEMSLKKLRAQRLRHKAALIIASEPVRACWTTR